MTLMSNAHVLLTSCSRLGFSQVTLSIRTAEQLKERIRLGEEPLFRGVSQRIIRLCGRTSDVTALSLSRYGSHIVPIFEDPDSVRPLIQEHTRNYERPIYWQASPASPNPSDSSPTSGPGNGPRTAARATT